MTNVVIRTIASRDGKRRVDVYRRTNGTYGFLALRWDDEADCLIPFGHYSESFTQSVDEAVAEASARVEWLAESLRDDIHVEVTDRPLPSPGKPVPAPPPIVIRLPCKHAEWLPALAGVLYFAGVFLREWILQGWLQIRTVVAPHEVPEYALKVQLILVALRVPALVVLLYWSACFRGVSGRDSGSLSQRRLIAIVAAVVIGSLVLDFTQLWPFTWRTVSSDAVPFISALVKASAPAAAVVWFAVIVLLNPLLEEYGIRAGLIHAIQKATGSSAAALVGSALVFSLLHLGTIGDPISGARLINLLWLYVGSLVLGRLVQQGPGGIRAAFIIHATRNAVECLTLLSFVSRGSG